MSEHLRFEGADRMPAKLHFDVWGVSHEGKVRALNEDRLLVNTRSKYWVVADGMGGHDGGDVASTAIMDALGSVGVASSAPDFRARIVDRLRRANDEILDIARRRDAGTIGSTVVALLVFEDKFACLWCGDSRLYLIRNGKIHQISRDHSEVAELLAQGVISEVEAETWPRKNVITRAIGVAEDPQIDYEHGDIGAGDIFVLCSDGLTAHLNDQEILARVQGQRSEAACESLVATTLERGATDNVTVVVVRCQSAETTIPISERDFHV